MHTKIRSRQWGKLGLGALLLSSQVAYADISGKAFRDFNANGVFDTGSAFNEVGMAGINVKAFDAADTQVATATSAADGTYTLSGLSSGANYRLEFSWSENWLKAGAAGGTSVQFVQDGAANADFALNALGEYSSPSDPRMLTSIFSTGSVSSKPSIQSFIRSSTGLNATFQNGAGAQGTGPIPGDDALANQVGSVWGIAWQANKKRVFAASFLKRHVGLKDGLGYVYVLDETSNPGALAGSFNLQGVTPANGGSSIDLGSVCRDTACATGSGRTGIAADYVLPSVGTTPSVDLDAFYKVGSVGFGDADMEPGTDRLWLVNAYQQALISVDVSADNVGTLPTDVRQYIIASLPGAPTCTGGNLRPWALKFREGKGYLGVTCDAFNSRQQADLKSVVVSFDPANISAGFSNVLSLPLNYKRTIPYFPFYPWMNQADVNTGWIMKDVNGAAAYPQPLLSDIEFDDAGNIYLAIMDLFVHQVGAFQHKPISGGGDGKLINGMTTGDFLKACKVGNGFEFEGSANCPAKIANGSGPNGGGQFFEDSAGDGRGESVNGALAYLSGSNQINAVTMDPHPDGQTGDPYIGTQGASTYDLTTGKSVDWYSLVYSGQDSSYFGKGNGIGDIELLLDAVPVEIGNRVWLDADEDGIQDADEAGIPDVQVQLLSGSTVIASATTAADGTYYFSSATGTDSSSRKYGLTQLQPNAAYTVRFPTTLTVAGASYGLSTAKAGSNTLLDSDAAESGDVAVAATDIPVAGANNHSFDVGYSPSTPPFMPPPGPTAMSCPGDVRLATSIQVNGDSQAAGSTGADVNSLVTFDYTASGVLSSPFSKGTAKQVGAVWGLAYDGSRNKLYASTFLKRHASFGPNGPGAIYQMDGVSSVATPSLLLDLAANGVDVGASPRVPSSGAVDDPNELPTDVGTPSWDRDAFALIGKMSLGDIDISADGNTLWAVNLKQRELIEIALGTTASVTGKHVIPDPGCSDGDYRPWAVKVHDGKVWIGTVCSAETSQSAADLKAYVQVFDGTDFTNVYSFALDYPRGNVGNGPGGEHWQPWTDTYQTLAVVVNGGFAIYPQPILSDIEFDMDGSMILGLMDRMGHQIGGANYLPDYPDDDTIVQGQTGGDILRVCNNNGTYSLESNGSCSSGSTAGKDNGQGPGNGEYYWGEMWDYNAGNASGGFHQETSFGGLAFKAGSGDIVLTAVNPLNPNPDPNANAGGVIWLSNTTGGRAANQGVQLYRQVNATDPYFGKAAGMGDVEIFCAQAPMVDVALTKSIDPAAAKRGEAVVYSLTVTNTGANTATGVKVTDKLPDGLTFVSHDGASPDVYDAITGEWNVGTVEVGAANAITLKITATVN